MPPTLTNGAGHRVTLNTLGAAIAGIYLAGGDGGVACVTVDAGGSAGKTIGRYANRIARGEFVLDGTTYKLPVNEGRNTLHGGPDGFSKREWRIAGESAGSIEFALHSPDGDQGFPGTMECRVRYTWSDDDALRIDYEATTDKPTVINLTNHVYFNLTADPAASIAAHELEIPASAYTPLDAELIPTGEIAAVAGTSRDFRKRRPIGNEKFDCNFALDGADGSLRHAATMHEPASGRTLVVETTQPGLQLYTGKPGAVALETQHFADAPHHPNFRSTVLRPGQTFRATTVYRFE
ncbi:MAG: galactose mutarotase [Candidatus Eremiobacteraeota bacterium]|nr:galactose mutarotase [Candidatus Eremiobacteraeota bacterium]